MSLRVANGAGFLGDNLDAPRLLVDAEEVDYLTLEYLAELTLSILAYQKRKQPLLGYARDFLRVLQSLTPALQAQKKLSVVTNAGGVNSRQCAREAARILVAADLGHLRVACIEGDDLLSRLADIQAAGCALAHADTGEPLSELTHEVVGANAYLGAAPIVQALHQQARIVITGRVADASLTLGPALHHYGWNWQDWPRLAGASVAGHLIECGAQVTGGYSQRWRDLNLADVGYPIAEIEGDGSAVITKPRGTGGRVDRQSVVEQLIYEIGNPAQYMTPDVIVDFTTVSVQEQARDRVAVTGASGHAAPDNYKVSLAYHDGYMASGQLLVAGRDCVAKAQHCAGIVKQRVERAGYELAEWHVECLGAGSSAPHLPQEHDVSEVVLRMTARDASREAVERFTQEIAPLITSGPAGLAGYATARSSVRPVFAYWPTFVPKQLVTSRLMVHTASEWTLE